MAASRPSLKSSLAPHPGGHATPRHRRTSGSMTCATAVRVALIRARDRAYIVVPDDVHPLWRPLIETCERLPRLQLLRSGLSTDDFRRGNLPLGS